jgi:serine protease Do
LIAPAFAGAASSLGAGLAALSSGQQAGSETLTVAGAPRGVLLQVQNAFTDIAKSAEPFVVNITASHSLATGFDGGGGGDNAPDGAPAPRDPKAPDGSPSPFPRQEQATGSGLIVRSDGYVLTNDHVVEGSPFVTVTLSDGREYRGKVIADFRSDLAVVKIDPGDAKLPVATFADSDEVQPGQWAIAIGSPFDLQNTMTVGVISAVHREQTIGDDSDRRYYPDLIQTDAAINPGNSGGPLLNIDGEVVGVNVAIESPVEGSAGVGFAIPAKTAEYVMNQLIANGKVVRGYLGMEPDDLSPLHQVEYGVPSGAWVEQVVKDSPAGKAGIRATDIVTQFNGAPVAGELSLRNAIAATPPGQTVPITVVRDGKTITLNATVAAPPAQEADNPPGMPGRPKVGVTYRALTASDRQQLSLTPDVTGVLVSSVAPNSPADSAELLPNDIIESIDRHGVTSVDDVSSRLDALKPGDTSTVVVLRSEAGVLEEIALDLRI